MTTGLGMETGRDGKGKSASVVTCTRNICLLTNRPPCLSYSFLCPFPKIKIEKGGGAGEEGKKSNHETKPKSKMNSGEMPS